MIRRLRSFFRPKPRFLGRSRTCDSVRVNRKFNMPATWYSMDHLRLWIQFLRDRCSERLITVRKCREKIRAAIRACDQQRHEIGYLPAERYGDDYHDTITRELQRKALNV